MVMAPSYKSSIGEVDSLACASECLFCVLTCFDHVQHFRNRFRFVKVVLRTHRVLEDALFWFCSMQHNLDLAKKGLSDNVPALQPASAQLINWTKLPVSSDTVASIPIIRDQLCQLRRQKVLHPERPP